MSAELTGHFKEREADPEGPQPPGFISGKEAMRGLLAGKRVLLDIEADSEPVAVQAVPRCDTCAHWRNPYDQNGKTMGFCGKAKAMDEPEEGLLCQAHSPSGILLTPGDWGCVRWAPKQ